MSGKKGGAYMKGDSIIVEEYHRRAAEKIIGMVLPEIEASEDRYTITVAGESGSGKSETAQAIADELGKKGIKSVIFQQDDYFVYPPRTNDKTRRKDISWVGPQEVRLDVFNQSLTDFLDGKKEVEKPLVIYDEDRIDEETMDVGNAKVAIAEGTYTTLLRNVHTRVFIARNHLETRAHREKRIRHESELDEFIDKVLEIEHETISRHRAKAHIVITKDYEVQKNEGA
jgi:uridine kinase